MNDKAKTKSKTGTGKHKVTVSLTDPRVKKFAESKADNEFDGNMSLYVRTLIRRDMGKVAA